MKQKEREQRRRTPGQRIRLFALLVMCMAGVSGALTATAGAVTYETQGCAATAPQWRIIYRLHPTDTQGRSVPPATLAAAPADAAHFAQLVGDLSGCAVRMRVDVVEDAGAWTGAMPSDGYDAPFALYPATGQEDYGGRTYSSVGGFVAVYPAFADGRGPNEMTLVHEWLHIVTHFYRTPLGWPAGDVHACKSYAPSSTYDCNTPALFGALMTGTYMENGQSKGLPVDQWAYQGTPLTPLNVPALDLKVTPPSGLNYFPGGSLQISGPVADADDIQLVYTDLDNGKAINKATAHAAGGRVSTGLSYRYDGAGRYRVCAVANDRMLAVTGKGCADYTVPDLRLPKDSDGDRVPDDRDGCPTLSFATPTGCPAPQPLRDSVKVRAGKRAVGDLIITAERKGTSYRVKAVASLRLKAGRWRVKVCTGQVAGRRLSGKAACRIGTVTFTRRRPQHSVIARTQLNSGRAGATVTAVRVGSPKLRAQQPRMAVIDLHS